MILFIHFSRRDGKYPVTLAFDGGKRFKKLFTQAQVTEWAAKSDELVFPDGMPRELAQIKAKEKATT